MLSTVWGYEESADIGKTVCFTLDIRASAPAGDEGRRAADTGTITLTVGS